MLESFFHIFEFCLVFKLDIFERFDKFLKHIDKTFGLFFIFAAVALPLVFVLQPFLLNFLPEVMVFIDEHLKLRLDFLMVLVDIVVVGEFFDGFCEFGVYLDQFFQRLL